MKDEEKTKSQLIDELKELRWRVSVLEALKIRAKMPEGAGNASDEKMQLIIESSPIGIRITQYEKIVYVNPAFIKMFGYDSSDEVLGRSSEELYAPDYRDLIRQRRADRLAGKPVPDYYTVCALNKNGEPFDAAVWVTLIDYQSAPSILAFLVDVSAEKKLREQLFHAQKMESIGTLAGGIAHDFNNLLMGIQGNVSLLSLGIDSGHPYFEKVRNIEKHIQRGAELTRLLLGFAKSGKYEAKPSNLNDLVRNSAKMFGRTKKEIAIHTKYQAGIWLVNIDRGQIDQVLLNLYVNAAHAMPEGGDLFIETENVTLDKGPANPYPGKPRKYVKISVTDTGVGMDEATRQRVFDPFFTTKAMGGGSGLGLAASYGIVENQGGFITVYSEKGHGSTFNVYLPATEEEKPSDIELPEKIFPGKERVLLIDDEAMVIEVAAQMLEKMGYSVLTAHSGKEAIEIYRANRERIDMVILDMTMPDMGGGETFDRLREIAPEIKVLLSSGYSINSQAADILARGCNGFIQKPFNMGKLSKTMRQIFEGGAADEVDAGG